MNSKAYSVAALYFLLAVSGSLYSIGEKTVKLGGDSGWKMVEYRNGVSEAGLVRPAPVLLLSSSGASSGAGSGSVDMALSFDEGNTALFRDSAGNYRVTVSPLLAAADRRSARAGFGAAVFSGPSPAAEGKAGSLDPRYLSAGGPVVMEPQNGAALFAPGSHIGDFTIEFWLHPFSFGTGEEVLLWNSARPSPLQKGISSGGTVFQRIQCVSARNRLQWSFLNLFTSPDGLKSMEITVPGVSAVVPKTWSHHLIRFDSGTGMIEYLMNGKSESIEYATSTGHEGGEVYTPVTGEGSVFVLGGGFLGLMDEFKIHGSYVSSPAVRKYSLKGGRIETRAIDLGEGINDVIRLDAFGGRTSVFDKGINSEYRNNGRFLFPDDSEMQFFMRASDNPYRWESFWEPVIPGAELAGSVQGRYVQLAVDFYPAAGGEASPYLEELRITYFPDEPPLPPAQLTAVAMDGAVQLQWKSSPNFNTMGYLVYYGTSADDYFGEDAALGISPIDVGRRNSVHIDGLKNGVLYYFRVAAYSSRSRGVSGSFHAGEFSREVRARPLQSSNAASAPYFSAASPDRR